MFNLIYTSLLVAHACRSCSKLKDSDIRNGFLGLIEDVQYHHWLIVSAIRIYTATFYHQLTLFTVTLYSWTLMSLEMADYQFQLIGEINEKFTTKQCNELIQRKQYSNDLKIRFNRMFAIFPLIWFASCFVESSGLLLQLSSKGLTWYNSARLVHYSINFVLITSALCIAIKIQDGDSDTDDRVIQKSWLTLRSVDADCKLGFRDAFRKQIPLSAILFNLEKPLVMSFVSSLVSFTVMFIQLNENLAQSAR
ncbi:hypothetical protein HDE_04645 [Halotydeus destructor]|nr:hypothetical protein HDE_04645 [Halotydeus destructor]